MSRVLDAFNIWLADRAKQAAHKQAELRGMIRKVKRPKFRAFKPIRVVISREFWMYPDNTIYHRPHNGTTNIRVDEKVDADICAAVREQFAIMNEDAKAARGKKSR